MGDNGDLKRWCCKKKCIFHSPFSPSSLSQCSKCGGLFMKTNHICEFMWIKIFPRCVHSNIKGSVGCLKVTTALGNLYFTPLIVGKYEPLIGRQLEV